MTESSIEKKEEIKTVYEPIKSLAGELRKIYESSKIVKAESDFFVSRMVSQAATIYEKMRNIIDYREEHLLRRNAIARILSRILKIHSEAESISSGLIKELVSSGYLKAEEVTSEKMEETTKTIARYLFFLNSLSDKSKKYFVGVASAEIENYLVSHAKVETIIKTLQKVITHDLEKINYREIENKSFTDQLFVVIHLVYLKSDNPIISYHLFKRYLVDWKKIDKTYSLSQITGELNQAKQKIQNQLKIARKSHLNKVVQIYKPLFSVLQDIANQNPEVFENYLNSPIKLTEEVNYLVEDKYREVKDKVKRSIVRAVIFIFITKMLLGVLLEIPYDIYFLGEVHTLPLTINLLFPPFLMFVSYFLIYIPDQKNTDKLIKGIKGVVYKETDYELLRKKITPTRRGPLLTKALGFLYILTFISSVSIIIWILSKLNFNFVSGFIFFFFLSIVSFFAFRIRQGANELTILEEKEGALATFIDFIFLPFLRIGHWISVKFASVNIFLFIFDFIIEAPFKTLLEIIDHWLAYIREKKEEISS